VALTDRRIPLGPTAGAALRDDLNDAVGRLGAVDRARGRPLDDLDALYVFRIEVIETRHDLLALGARRSGVRIVHDAHAVDVDERLRGQAERRDAADRDVRAGPRLPVAGREGDPRRPGIEHPGDVLRPGDLEALRHADLGHRVPDLAARLTAGGAADDLGVELNGHLSQRQPNVRGADADGPRQRGESQPMHGERDLRAGTRRYAKTAIRIGDGSGAGIHANLGIGDR